MTSWRNKRRASVQATISEEDSFSGWVFLLRGLKFNFSLSGSWVATVHFQRSFDGTTPLDVEEFTNNVERIGEEPEGIYYRFGVKEGNWTSGSVVGRISQ